jgi:hypothetical protein
VSRVYVEFVCMCAFLLVVVTVLQLHYVIIFASVKCVKSVLGWWSHDPSNYHLYNMC